MMKEKLQNKKIELEVLVGDGNKKIVNGDRGLLRRPTLKSKQ